MPVAFFARSTNRYGRLSFTAQVMNVDNGSPPGGGADYLTLTADPHSSHSEEDTQNFSLSSGTLTNLVLNTDPPQFNGVDQDDRLELDNAAAGGQWTTPEVDLTTEVERELTFWLGTANDTDDPNISTNPFIAPSLESDAWGVVLDTPILRTGMIAPPYPATELSYAVEVRTYVSSAWGEWRPFPFFTSILETFQKYQLRVTVDRSTAPYRPGIRELIAVVTS